MYPITLKQPLKKNSELANKLTNELNRKAEKGKRTKKINSKMLDLNLCQ